MSSEVCIERLEPFSDAINLETHSLTGWPHVATHSPGCGARAVFLGGTAEKATYECRGTPTEKWSDYGLDGCLAVFEVHGGSDGSQARP